jgi:hypothetical protein
MGDIRLNYNKKNNKTYIQYTLDICIKLLGKAKFIHGVVRTLGNAYYLNSFVPPNADSLERINIYSDCV